MRVLVSLIAISIVLASTSLAQQSRKSMREHAEERMTSPKYEEIVGRRGNGPAEGTMAPDFALQPLKFYEFGIDLEDITEANAGKLYASVRLSDFREHKPVVLIFGSYT